MFASSLDGSADEEPLSKGGHSLRKRARVDYTQEQIDDDLGSYDSKHDPATRLSTAPSARGRNKRRTGAYDLSDNDSDESNPAKRRRPEKSPTRQRAVSARRKQSGRKSTSDIRDYLDQPSDNEVQDTILVSVPMGQMASSDARSSSPPQSDEQSEFHRSTPSEADTIQGEVKSPSPISQEQVAPVEQSTTERGGPAPPQLPVESQIPEATTTNPPYANGMNKLNSAIVEDTTLVLSNDNKIASPRQEAAQPVAQSIAKSAAADNLIVPPDQAALEPTKETSIHPTTQDIPPSPAAVVPDEGVPSPATTLLQKRPVAPVSSPTQENAVQPAILEKPTQPANAVIEEKPEIPMVSTPQEGTVLPEAPKIHEQLASPTSAPAHGKGAPVTIEVTPVQPTSTPTATQVDGSRDEEIKSSALAPAEAVAPYVPRRPEARKLQQLMAIYLARCDRDGSNPLSPYVEGDVAYPSPWTEVVVDRPEPTPTPTPAAMLTPPEPSPIDDMWDGMQPLKVKDFFTLYRADVASRKEKGEAPISMQEFRRFCSYKRQAALSAPPVAPPKRGRKAAPKATAASRYRRKATLAANELDPAVQTPDQTPQASPAPESAQPTPARSPEPLEDYTEQNEPQQEVDDDGQVAEPIEGEIEVGDAEAADGEADAEIDDGPAGPSEILVYPKKQYAFRKIRPESDFAEALADYQNMDTPALYRTLASTTETLEAWQAEYTKLKQITDDEDNAKRRQANDKTIENWDKRQKLDELPSSRRTFDDSFQRLPAPFEVKGVRAPAPYIDDPLLERQRAQDRIQAQAYGFVHNNHSSYIGRQRPREQRWELDDTENETRLRERKQTQKAADAAEESVIIEGKRTRKPRILGDQSQEPSRAATPVPPPRQRRRRNATMAAESVNGDGAQNGEAAHDAVAEPSAPVRTPQKRGRGKAKANQNEAVAPTIQSTALQSFENQAAVDKPKATRKRGRPAASAEGTLATNNTNGFNAVDEDPALPKTKRQRTGRTRPDVGLTTDIPPMSFYSNPSPADTGLESRPSTSSSTTTVYTVGTVDSSYSLRDKKKRNYAEDNDPDFETPPMKRARGTANKDPQGSEPPKKRDRRRKNTAAEEMAEYETQAQARPVAGIEQFMGTFDAGPPPPPSGPVKQIKVVLKKNNMSTAPSPLSVATPASEVSTPAPGTATPAPAGARLATKAPKMPKAPKAPKFPNAAAVPTPTESGTSTQAAADDGGEPGEKPYSEMTKSEKMSYSMRRKYTQFHLYHCFTTTSSPLS